MNSFIQVCNKNAVNGLSFKLAQNMNTTFQNLKVVDKNNIYGLIFSSNLYLIFEIRQTSIFVPNLYFKGIFIWFDSWKCLELATTLMQVLIRLFLKVLVMDYLEICFSSLCINIIIYTLLVGGGIWYSSFNVAISISYLK